VLFAVFVYFFGLDSQQIPKNGDEYPYAHITRLTAASGHLLPLQSELKDMRNTKPPLLFWQGIASTNWGKNWTLWHLRYPSVIYTVLTALLVLLLARRLSGQLETGVLALLVFLAFFSTYRYGRPFLTNPPEVFWLFLPFFVLLYWRPAAFDSRWLAPLLLGMGIGLGLLYKSFTLALPVLLGLTSWYLCRNHYRLRAFLALDAWKLALMGVVSLAIFSLWFVLDPNPQAILKEFVLGENLGKFEAKGHGYLSTLLWGGSSIWALALGYPLNAGLLALPVAALFYDAWRRRAQLSAVEKLLWLWLITLFLVFCLPSQRSSRYLLPAMPALAVLCALNWHRLDRRVFIVSLVAAGLVLATGAYLSIRLQQGAGGPPLYPLVHWALLAAAAGFILVALFVPRVTVLGTPVATLLVFLGFASFVRPFDGPLGTYGAEVQQYVKGKDVWVPINFRAKEEGYRFLLPGANVHPYRYEPNLTAAGLSAQYPLFAIRLPLSNADAAGSKVIGQRLVLSSRQNSRQIREMLRGRVFEHLFLKELLIEAAAPVSSSRR
jgi:4-amino-4-deoxy-L-arabinose transferase-like glycosyltransferase